MMGLFQLGEPILLIHSQHIALIKTLLYCLTVWVKHSLSLSLSLVGEIRALS